MKPFQDPSPSEWMELYAAASAFYATKSWEWMYDDDIFVIDVPGARKAAFCCIMGSPEKFYALCANLGTQGMHGFQMLSNHIGLDDLDLSFMQHCIMCYFVKRATLDRYDLSVIKSLGLKYRGRNAWPMFRFYEPGFPAWHLNDAQCRHLTHLLLQANDIALRCHKDKDLIHKEDENLFFVRTGTKHKHGVISWQDDYKVYEHPKFPCPPLTLTEQAQVKKLLLLPTGKNMVLEIDFFYLPSVVLGKKRPYHPLACVIADHFTDQVISFQTSTGSEKERFQFRCDLLEIMKQKKVRPSALLVSREEVCEWFTDLADALDIPILMVETLDTIKEFRLGLLSSMRR